jgi:hypothetical protein
LICRSLAWVGHSHSFVAHRFWDRFSHYLLPNVLVQLEDGFQYKNTKYRSLSAIAKEVTGTVWNGLTFFHLAKRNSKAAT